MKSRGLFGALCAVLGMMASGGVANAELDDEHSIVDAQGRTLTIQQWDTFLNGVAPLDRNRLTREWFYNGRVKYAVSGPGAEEFEGKVELGYQISFPWAMGVGLNFTYTTPNYQEWNWVGNQTPFGWGSPPWLPGGSINVDLNNGPGLEDIVTVAVPVKGPEGATAVSNGHGMVTGAAGGVTLRPFARLVSSTGDAATTYGEIWNMN